MRRAKVTEKITGYEVYSHMETDKVKVSVECGRDLVER